ncbi:TPA: hypothetical protein HA242_05295 [Candidatus Woesearchaeota archaeon]|nr:hypothetical protein [Candidatus Woesearchaeota archaeon]
MYLVDKRGIAPLIATMLLLSFAVSLGVVVMNFGRAQVELQAQCPINIGLKLAVINGQNQICYDLAKKEVTFTVENGVNINVEGLILNAIGSKEAKSTELNDAKIIKTGTYLGHASFDSSISGDLRQIKIIPKVIMYDEEQICVEKALIAENIKAC